MGRNRAGVIWREVPGTGGLYEVSEDGQVRSWNAGRWGRRNEPYLMTQRPNDWGYLMVHMGKRQLVAVHTLVCAAFHGPRPDGAEAAHQDGDNRNNHAGNLAWKTPQQNAQDRDLHGTTVRGERHPKAKLTEVQVLKIRARRGAGEANQDVAAAFGVSPQLVSDIVAGRKWRHVQEA